jgi:hypothetical protein
MEPTLAPGRHETIKQQDVVRSGVRPGWRALVSPGRSPKLPPATSTGTRSRRWCSGAALRASHSASSADDPGIAADRRLCGRHRSFRRRDPVSVTTDVTFT